MVTLVKPKKIFDDAYVESIIYLRTFSGRLNFGAWMALPSPQLNY